MQDGSATGPRLLFIVARTETKLHGYARSSFADVRSIEVVLDRRQSERRRAEAPAPVERRQRDRRRMDVNDRLQRLGWVVVHHERSSLPAALGRPPAPGLRP